MRKIERIAEYLAAADVAPTEEKFGRIEAELAKIESRNATQFIHIDV
jgi:hypothetical protein